MQIEESPLSIAGGDPKRKNKTATTTTIQTASLQPTRLCSSAVWVLPCLLASCNSCSSFCFASGAQPSLCSSQRLDPTTAWSPSFYTSASSWSLFHLACLFREHLLCGISPQHPIASHVSSLLCINHILKTEPFCCIVSVSPQERKCLQNSRIETILCLLCPRGPRRVLKYV